MRRMPRRWSNNGGRDDNRFHGNQEKRFQANEENRFHATEENTFHATEENRLHTNVEYKNRANEENEICRHEENKEGKTKKEDVTEYIVKILLSGKTAWTISNPKEFCVKEKFGIELRLSKSDDYYPGTSEKVCLINGKINEIKPTLDWILNIDCDGKEVYQQQVKLLIPKTSLGSLFSKGYGKKFFWDQVNVELHIPDYNPEDILREVCATLSGRRDNLIDTCIHIAKIIKYDQFSRICRNVSYEEFNYYLRKKEANNSFPNFVGASRLPMQQSSVIMSNLSQSWMQQQDSPMQQYHQRNTQPMQNYFPTQNQFGSQMYPQQQQQQQQQELPSYQTTQPNFYFNQAKQYSHQISLNQLQQIETCLNQLQQNQQKQEQQPLQTITKEQESNSNKTNADDVENSTEKAAVSSSSNQPGKPIPSVSSTFWKRANAGNWRFNNNNSRALSNVEVIIPGLN